MVANNPDEYVVIDYPDTYAKFGAALVRTGKFDPTKLMVPDALSFSTVPSNIPPQAIDGARGTRGGAPVGTAAYKLFDELWQKAGGVEHASLDSNSFDSTTLCALGAAAAHSADPGAIRDQILRLATPGAPKYTLTNLADAFKAVAAGQPIDYVGASGAFEFGENGDPSVSLFDIFEYRRRQARRPETDRRAQVTETTGGTRRRFLPAVQGISRAGWLGLGLLAILGTLTAVHGIVPAGQATLNGLVSAGTYGLGAVGLTLVFGVLRLVNFAHGDLLTLGAYLTLAFAGAGAPFWAAAAAAIVATALVSVLLDRLVWQHLRRAETSTLQLFLVAIGLALFLRYTVQFFAGSQMRSVGLDTLSAVDLGPWHLGTLQLVVILIGVPTIVATALALRFSSLGKMMRALADNAALAEVTGIDTQTIIRITWAFGGGLAALAGILYAAAIGSINPNFGGTILLSLFAAAVLGGIGDAYGALAGGVVIGLSQEWSTLFFNPRWKPAVGFAVLILTLVLMPRGIFGRVAARS